MMFHAGDGFHYERLPEGTRVVYPPEPLVPLTDPYVAIERALLMPMGMEPLHELLKPGLKLTIVFDDLSLPLPPMRPPDTRQMIIEKVLEKAAAKGVEDIHLIAALGLHRRMTETELKWILGKKIMSAFYPDRLYNYDAEDEENHVVIGTTDYGEEVCINRRAAESNLLVYVNISIAATNGGHKSVHTGISPYSSLRHHHNVRTLEHTRSLMDPQNSALHDSLGRMGKVLDENLKVFHIESTINSDVFPTVFDFLSKPEQEWNAVTKAKFLVSHKTTNAIPRVVSRKIFQSMPAPHRMTSVQAGAADPVHDETLRNVYRQQLVFVKGQSDILLMGIPYLGPYNVNSIMNPLLVHCMLLGYLFNLYKGKPLVRKGGVLVATHPIPNNFHKIHHPSYIDFFNEVLPDTTDPKEIEQKYEEQYAYNLWYRMLYRNSYAYHGVHPFYMWYWGAHALAHLGDVIFVGGNPMTTSRMGYKRADTVAEALQMAKDVVGPSPSMTYMRLPPPFMCEVS
jgi:lactate racemase